MNKLICFLILGALALQVNNVIAEVPFDIKLPFPAGESRGITCIYHDIEPSCITHAEFNSKGKLNGDEWAIDFNLVSDGDKDKSVVAIASGKVVTSKFLVDEKGFGYGNYIDIDHKNGYKSRYAHLNSRKVIVGDEVDQGQEIGKVGDSGAKDNYHLHFALYKINKDGKYLSVKPIPMSGYKEFYSTAGTADYPFTSDNHYVRFNFNDGTSQGWIAGRDTQYVQTAPDVWIVNVIDTDKDGVVNPGVLSPVFGGGVTTDRFARLKFIAKISSQPLGVQQGNVWIETSDGNWNHQFTFTQTADNGNGFHAYQVSFPKGLAINQFSIELTQNNTDEKWEFDEIELMGRPSVPSGLTVK